MGHFLGRSNLDDPASGHSPQPTAYHLRIAEAWRACRIGDGVSIRGGDTLVRRGVVADVPDGLGYG